MFPKLCIDMSIQSQVSNVHALHVLQCVNKKRLFTSYPAAKHQNTANLALKTTRKFSRLFVQYHTGGGFNSHNNFANLGSFAKISILVESIIPWYVQGIED